MTDHRVLASDGRTLGVSEVGPADGPVVVLSHPAPGSRLWTPIRMRRGRQALA